MKSLIKRMLHILLKDYKFNRIYFVDLPVAPAQPGDPFAEYTIRLMESREQFASATDRNIRDHAWYLDKQSYVYCLYHGDDLACICSFWIAGHPGLPACFSGLKENEIIMVDLLTATRYRGKGYALTVIRFAENDLFLKGYNRLWAWVWHSNHPSIRVFEKKGWKYSYQFLEFQPYGMKDHLRIKLPAFGP